MIKLEVVLIITFDGMTKKYINNFLEPNNSIVFYTAN